MALFRRPGDRKPLNPAIYDNNCAIQILGCTTFGVVVGGLLVGMLFENIWMGMTVGWALMSIVILVCCLGENLTIKSKEKANEP